MADKKYKKTRPSEAGFNIPSAYASRYMATPISKHVMPAEPMPSYIAYQLVHDEIVLDGKPAQNLASFVTAWMEPEADKLIEEGIHYNLADEDEYPHAIMIQQRCVNMLANLLHVPNKHECIGTNTIGSSEAMMLAGLAMKKNWKRKRSEQNKATDKPNLVMGENVQVCWEKFARYFDVEPRLIPIQPGRYIIGPDEILAAIDENTIGVCAILGTTFTGEFEPIKDINDALMQSNAKTGWDIPIHVDGASGGFVAPFLYPDLEWDFRLPLVKSVNMSGHKYGLVYPGIGWVVWRDKESLPDDLVFHVNYLGGDMPTFNLNFSRPASHVFAQYYNFIRLGKLGYTNIMRNLKANAVHLFDAIEAMGDFTMMSNKESMPVVVWSVKEDAPYNAFQLADKMREFGWIIPAYTMPKNAEDVVALRIVIRERHSRSLVDSIIDDLNRAIKLLSVGSTTITKDKHKSVKVC